MRFTVQTIVVFVSFGVFFIQWLPPRQLKTVSAIFIASAFLSIGILTFAHIMTCSMLLNITGSSEAPVGSFFQMMAGVTMGGSLLIAAYIPKGLRARKGDSNLLLIAFLVYTSVVVAVAATFGSYFPSLCPHDASADATRIVVEVIVAITMLIATAKYYKLGRTTHDMTFSYLSAATLLGAFDHAAFCLHSSPNDGYSVLYMVFIIASFVMVFVALFSKSVTQPYDRLRRAQSQSEKRRKEVEAASVKAQTYLDFLSHDIANMIAPILNRAEIIQESRGASEKDKEEAKKIVEQTQKVASLIANLRRLSMAERIDVRNLGTVDLRIVFSELERTRRESHPEKNLRVTVMYPGDDRVLAIGGNTVEEIISEVFDNVVKHSQKEFVRIRVNIVPERKEPNRAFWRIEILDNGPGIPDHVKTALNVRSSDPDRRFTRGVISGISVMSLMTEQLGGSITIGDRVPGDHTQGTKVVIVIPRAQPRDAETQHGPSEEHKNERRT